jgi:hypothetical protein
MLTLTIITKTAPLEIKVADIQVLAKAIEGLDANKGLFIENIWVNKSELIAITIAETKQPEEEKKTIKTIEKKK